MASGNHLRGVPVKHVSTAVSRHIIRDRRRHLHIIVDFDLGEQSNALRHQTECDVTTAITRGTLDTLPILDTGQDDIDQLTEEVVHVLTLQLSLDSNGVTAWVNTPSSNTGPGLEGLDANIGNCLDGNTSNVQPRRVLGRSVLHVTVISDALDFRDVVELNGLAEQAQDITTTGTAENTVLVVG